MAAMRLVREYQSALDGILTDLIKSGTDAVNTSTMRGSGGMIDAIVLIFNFVFDNETWPERWGTGIISPLYKQDSRLDPSNYRPVTLMSVMGKLFGVVVNQRLQGFTEAYDCLADEQGGFRPERGTWHPTRSSFYVSYSPRGRSGASLRVCHV